LRIEKSEAIRRSHRKADFVVFQRRS
jgi:hypothetical protein